MSAAAQYFWFCSARSPSSSPIDISLSSSSAPRAAAASRELWQQVYRDSPPRVALNSACPRRKRSHTQTYFCVRSVPRFGYAHACAALVKTLLLYLSFSPVFLFSHIASLPGPSYLMNSHYSAPPVALRAALWAGRALLDKVKGDET